MARIEPFDTAAAWIEACVERLAAGLSQGLAERGRALFAGAGGSTPAPIYRRLAGADLDWSRIVVTLVDERYVPETSPESNARLLKETLMTGPAAAAGFTPLYHNAVTVDRAAALATRALAQVGDRLDSVLLGMGEDGHIASMFPRSPTLKQLLALNNRPSVFGVPQGRDGTAPSLERLSLNLPWFAGARRVVLAITGPAKHELFAMEAVADPTHSPIAALVAARAEAGTPLEVLWTESP